jgi:hypothetical protein
MAKPVIGRRKPFLDVATCLNQPIIYQKKFSSLARSIVDKNDDFIIQASGSA